MAEVYYAAALYSYLRERKGNSLSELEKRLHEFSPPWTAIIPAYNEEDNIQQSLDSVINQTYPPVEIIILDDHSSDNTPRKVFQLLKQYDAKLIKKRIIDDEDLPFGSGQKRAIIRLELPKLDMIITYVRNLEKNVGKTMNLNWAVFNLVKTPYFANIDGDTILEKDYAEKVLPLLLEDKVAAAFGFALPRVKGDKNFIYNLIYHLKYFLYAKRGQILRRFWQLIGFHYNLFGAAVFYNKSYFEKVPRPLIGNSRDTFHAWILQLKGYKVRGKYCAIAYPESEGTIKYFIKERKRWGSGAYQAFYLLFKEFIRLKKYKESVVPLMTYLIPVKYSIAVYTIPLLSLVSGDPYLFIKFSALELLLYGTGVSLSKLLKPDLSLKKMGLGLVYMYTVGKYIISALILRNFIVNTVDYLTGQWKEKWRFHNT